MLANLQYCQVMHTNTHTGIIIGIGEVDVTVDEGEGTVEVCAEVISGDLQRSVSFTLTSTDGTATDNHSKQM